MSNEKEQIDVAIVGGGIVGLWCAYAFLKRHPGHSVVVFEARDYLGEHTSGRNSEVLHSGIYYPKGSLKHRHCLEGNRLWRDYVSQKKLPFLDCGKVVAATAGQRESLEKLLEQGQNNGVPGVRRLKSAEIQALQSVLNIDDGFFCATSGVLNVAEALASLRNDVESMGGIVLLRTKAKLLEHSGGKFRLDINGDEIHAANLVNAAGLFAVEFRRSLGLSGYEDFFVKGSYLKLARKLKTDSLVYPIPPPDGLGLGVHITMDTAGEQKFGPDTEVVERIDYSIDDSLRERMFPAIQQIFKNVRKDDLQLGYAGIRPKVKKSGTLVTDFVLNAFPEHHIKGYFEFLGIESPGITASPSLAHALSEML